MSVPAFCLLSAVVLVGSLLQVSIGFGLGMLAAPVIALLDPTLVPVVLLLLATGVTTATVLAERAHLDLRGAGWALGGRVPGTIAGAALVAFLPAKALALSVAAVVLAGVVVSLRGFRPRPTPRAVALAGAASGLMGTATSIGGPPMALVWQRYAGPKMRGTMSAFFLVGSVLSLGALAVAGVVHLETLRYSALLAPAAAAGVLLARPLSRHLDESRTRGVAMALAVAGAVTLTVQQFL
ncbi:sulfite exporter TauE/SafE family protein [Amycolatopsis sp. YIM 10]|uniref:sulfite exporter TauE/SafE family protein n=1 Tax=Amycolatopsis sp. YIM 10 TaxID=2653857 RepID=UPI0012905F8A|nr:sulfite exporter TauE/SafE family protein [Amycolatopsis sp. YIM 10]QFU88488.1 Sulfite exporter TauE/SafE [Amycolatopsis sp. YIM 10]